MNEVFIPGPLPGLNELLAQKRHRTKNGGDAYNVTKAAYGGQIAMIFRASGVRRIERAILHFVWVEPHRRRDPDNVSAGGRKLILDSLTDAGILVNGDGWKGIVHLSEQWEVDANRPGVRVSVVDAVRIDEQQRAFHSQVHGVMQQFLAGWDGEQRPPLDGVVIVGYGGTGATGQTYSGFAAATNGPSDTVRISGALHRAATEMLLERALERRQSDDDETGDA